MVMLAAPIRAFSIAALVLLFTPAIVHSIYQDDIDSIERFVGATNEAASDGMPYKVAPNRNHGIIVVAQAETPSNTCARERTECLRARVQKGILGSEYVPPDDTARCQAAYQACLAGQQQSVQPAPRPPTTPNAPGAVGGQQGVLPPPKPAAPSTQQKAPLPTTVVGGLLASVKRIALDGPTPCVIDGERITCTPPPHPPVRGISVVSHTLSGIIVGNTLELDLLRVLKAGDCTDTDRGHIQVVLEAGGRALHKQTTTLVVSGCDKPMTRADNYTSVGTWRVLE